MTVALALLGLRGPTPVADLPFEHLPGRILLKATLNGRPATAALDSGATVTVADERAALAASATRGAAVAVSGNGAAKVGGWRAAGLGLVLDGSDVKVPVSLAVPLDAVNAKATRPLDVVVGCDLLRRYVAEIDYAHGRLRLFDPSGYAPPRGYSMSPLRVVNGRPLVEGSLEAAGIRIDPVSMLVDSGLASGLDVGPDLVARSGWGERVVGDAAAGTAGLGGTARTRPLLGAKGSIGAARFSGGVRLVLTPGGGSADYDAKLGDEFLAHYDVVLNLPDLTLGLRRNGR